MTLYNVKRAWLCAALLVASSGCSGDFGGGGGLAPTTPENACASFVARLSSLPCWVGALPPDDLCAQMQEAISEDCEDDFIALMQCYTENVACLPDGSRSDVGEICAPLATECTTPTITAGSGGSI